MQDSPARHVATSLALVVAIIALVAATAALTATLVRPAYGAGMMNGGIGPAMMGGEYRPGMMGGGYGPGMMGPSGVVAAPQPGDPGFVAGTTASPRVVRVVAGPGFAFTPSTIAVARGETVTFLVTTMGPLIHELMVGPADAVAADRAGTPEVADIGMMETGALTYTFDGPGPYAFACHVEGHYEGGMRGTITIVG